MKIELFNIWYFVAIVLSIGLYVGLYFLLKNKTEKTKKIVLFSILMFALALHFMKGLWPPYSTNKSLWYETSWFVNICGANIAVFPFLFLSKRKGCKDYMFYIGLISGVIALLYPVEIFENEMHTVYWIDTLRFYLHHTIIWVVPLLMVTLKLHKVSYKRIWTAPVGLLLLMLFIILNQVLQSEMGFIGVRDGNFDTINFRNSSMIWGADGDIGEFLAIFCPDIFKTVPVGPHAGEPKYWPWFWIIFPVFILITPSAFLIAMIFDHKNFKDDCKTLFAKIKTLLNKRKTAKAGDGETAEEIMEIKTDDKKEVETVEINTEEKIDVES